MRILIVCTGNTCRSPLAEALLRRALAERGVERVEVASAGTGAWDGAPASEGSYLVALEHGLDLSAHRSRELTPELVRSADLILAMSPGHVARVEALGGAGRTLLLGEYAGRRGDAAQVADPFGAELEAYRRTFEDLAALIPAVADRVAAERSGEPS